MFSGVAVSPTQASAFGPVSITERVEVIDVLRGFALLGIVLVNLSMDLPWIRLIPQTSGQPGIDRALYAVIDVLAEGKFYVLFSFLFGLGFSIQMSRADARGGGFLRIYLRRLAFLYGIGFVLTLLVDETQLRIYATLGFVLLILRRVPPKLLLVLASALLLWTPVIHLAEAWNRRENVAAVQAHWQRQSESLAERTRQQQESVRIHSSGSFREIVQSHVPSFWSWSWLTGELPFLLLGLYAGRRRIFDKVAADPAFFRKMRSWGLVIGLPGCVLAHWIFERRQLWALDSAAWWSRETAELLDQVGSPALSLFYAAVVVLLFTADLQRWCLKRLAPVGRMALSNYILQWLAFMVLTHSFGLGLYGKLGLGTGLMIAGTTFSLQALLSAWYMKRFRFGPAEWLWRSVTYWRWQPMRLAAAPLAAGVAGAK